MRSWNQSEDTTDGLGLAEVAIRSAERRRESNPQPGQPKMLIPTRRSPEAHALRRLRAHRRVEFCGADSL